MLDSSSKCNIVRFSKKYLIGCLEPKSFPWKVVQSFHGKENLFISNGSKVPVFRKVLVNESWCVHWALFPMLRIHMSKIKAAFRFFCNRPVTGELLPIIRCNSVNSFCYGAQHSLHRFFSIFLRSSICY